MSDLIDRQQAINVIERTRAYIGHNMERAVGAAFIEILDDVGEDIGRLPSAQFATDTNVGTKLGTNLAQLGTDCISRQTVLNAIDEISREVDDGDGFDYAKWREYFCELPSAEPERDTPKRVLWTGWKGHRYTRYNCPNCKKPVRNDDVYCHRCGQRLMFPKVSHTPYVEGQKQEVIVRWDDE